MNAIRTLAAGVLAAVSIAGAAPATAADLNGDYGSYEGSYDDDRYAEGDRYYRDGHRYNGGDDDGDDYAYRGSYKDDGYLPEMSRAPRFSDDGDYGGYGQRCTPRWKIRQRILADGWRNVRRIAVRDRIVIIRAQRPSGRAFDLRLDRCTGDILAQRPSYIGRFGAYEPRHRRYGSAY